MSDEDEVVQISPQEAQNIILCRIYDLLAVIALDANPSAAEHVLNLHEDGRLVNNEVWLRVE